MTYEVDPPLPASNRLLMLTGTGSRVLHSTHMVHYSQQFFSSKERSTVLLVMHTYTGNDSADNYGGLIYFATSPHSL